MEFIVEEMNIMDEQIPDDHNHDIDIGHSSQYQDWKLGQNVECRVLLKRMESFQTEHEVQRDSDGTGEAKLETSAPQQDEQITTKSNSNGKKSKPYKCETCGKGFLTFYDLTQHKTTHISGKGEARNIGGKTLQTSSDSNQQQQGLLTQDGEKFSREISQNTSVFSSRVIRPNRDPMAQKPYECDTCGKKFFQQKNLNWHKLLHTRGKSYKSSIDRRSSQSEKKHVDFEVPLFYGTDMDSYTTINDNLKSVYGQDLDKLCCAVCVHLNCKIVGFSCDPFHKFRDRTTFRDHFKNFHMQRVVCSVCALEFKNKRAMQVHVMRMRKYPNKYHAMS